MIHRLLNKYHAFSVCLTTPKKLRPHVRALADLEPGPYNVGDLLSLITEKDDLNEFGTVLVKLTCRGVFQPMVRVVRKYHSEWHRGTILTIPTLRDPDNLESVETILLKR